MAEKRWERVGFPPLRLTLSQLEELAAAAGPSAELTRIDDESGALAVIEAQGMKLELAADHAALSFGDECAQTADELVALLAKQSSRLSLMLLPLFIGFAIFVPLMLLGFQLDLVSLTTLGGMLLGVVVVMLKSRSSGVVSEPIEGEQSRWHTTFPCDRLGFEDLASLVSKAGDDARLEFTSHAERPAIEIRAPGLELILRDGEGDVRYDDASSRVESFYDQVNTYSRPLRMFTHDDLSIFVGMLLPIAALFFAPVESQRNVALISVLPWLLYMQWVLANQRKRWCTIVETNA